MFFYFESSCHPDAGREPNRTSDDNAMAYPLWIPTYVGMTATFMDYLLTVPCLRCCVSRGVVIPTQVGNPNK